MTSPPVPSPPSSPPAAVVPVVTPTAESRLDQLAAEHALLSAQLTPLTERFEAVKEAIKAELAQTFPGCTAVLLTSPHLPRPLKLNARTTRQLQGKALREAHPQLWEAFAVARTTWRLDPVG